MSDERGNLSPSAESEQAAGAMTRRDCTIFGMTVFGLILGGSIVFLATVQVLVPGRSIGPLGISWIHVLKVLLVVVPPAMLFGAADGFDLYRLAMGSREWRPIGCLIWLLCCVFPPVGVLVLLFFVQYKHRENVIVQGAFPTWEGTVLYSFVMLAVGLALVDPGHPKDLPGAVFIGILAMFVADSVLVNCIARWRSQGLLAPPTSHVFQYSLGTLLIFVLSLGSWMTTLVLVFRR